jgi:hypothetical protein
MKGLESMAAILGGALPLAVLLLFILIARARDNRLPEAVTVAALSWTGVAVVSVELLTRVQLVTKSAVAVVWIAALVTAAVVCRRLSLTARAPVASQNRIDYANPILAIVLIAAATGLIAAPNNWDSMTYHLSRVEHWIQNFSIDHYPTAISRQLESGPLAEILILQFRILTGGERLGAVVQTLAFAGSIVAASSVALRLGATRPAQGLAALLVATIPMAILQASSTQNDLVASFFVLATAERLLAWRESRSLLDWLFASAALGFALLTKGTAYIFCAPMAVLAGLMALRSGEPIRLGAIMAIVVAGLNIGHYYRNHSYFSNPLGTLAGAAGSQKHGLGVLYSGLVRNIASNFATPIKPVNRQLAEVVRVVHAPFNLDVNDHDTTVEGVTFGLSAGVLHEDNAPNPLHTIIAFTGLALLVRALTTKKRLTSELIAYTAAAFVGGLMFCLMLKWQPWVTRLQLPFFVLMAPPAAILLCKFFSPLVVHRIAMVLIVAAVPAAVANVMRPLLPFTKGNIITTGYWRVMFKAKERWLEPYLGAVDLLSVSRPTRIGLVIGRDSWEYPAWASIDEKIGLAGRRIEHICTEHPTALAFSAEVVLLMDRPAPATLSCEGSRYIMSRRFDVGGGRPKTIYVYLPESPP